MTTNCRTGADALVSALMAAGVEHVFGLPGDTGVDLYDAFHRAQPGPVHVMCRDERHAATMADVYARARNRVGVVEVSSGGGATFCIGGLGEPFAASIPLLVISSDIHASSRNTGALTELDQERLFSAVTKWIRRVDRAADIPEAVTEALAAATSGRPAPVALIIPENVLAEATSAVAAPAPRATFLPSMRPSPAPEILAAVAAALSNAKRPAIVAGGGVHASAAYEQLAALAEAACIPIATTIHGKGAYPETGAWSLGVVGANGARPYANEYLETADFVLFIGTRANATDTNSFRSPNRATRVAQIDIDPQRAGRNYPGSLAIAADAQVTLALLATVCSDSGNCRDDLRAQLSQLRQDWRDQHSRAAPAGMIHPLGVLDAVKASFGAAATIVADCGTATPYLAAHWEVESAGRSLIVARGHGPMGYAIPGALGAAIASSGKRIVSLTTDGSFAMACGELETAARLNLPITFVQLTNGSYGWIKMLQHLYHDGRYFGVDLGPVDACAAARAFGVRAAFISSQAELESALSAEARNGAGPSYFEVRVPEQIAEAPPVASWTAALTGSDTVRPVY